MEIQNIPQFRIHKYLKHVMALQTFSYLLLRAYSSSKYGVQVFHSDIYYFCSQTRMKWRRKNPCKYSDLQESE